MCTAPSDAVNAFGEVDDLEVGGEGPDDLGCGRRVEPVQSLLEARGPGLFPLSTSDRRAPCALDALEEPFAALFADHLPDEFSKKANILSERLVFLWEVDVTQAQGWAHYDEANRRPGPDVTAVCNDRPRLRRRQPGRPATAGRYAVAAQSPAPEIEPRELYKVRTNPPLQTGQATQWLTRLRDGDSEALDRLLPILYDELRVLARHHLRRERADHTLGATALVHEAYFRLAGQTTLRPEDRGQFFAFASQSMRRVLVDHARARKRIKRGSGVQPVPLSEVTEIMSESEADEILSLNDALDRLQGASERGARVVELRYFGGLTLEETAEALGVSVKTVQRDWTVARAWLRKEVEADLRVVRPH